MGHQRPQSWLRTALIYEMLATFCNNLRVVNACFPDSSWKWVRCLLAHLSSCRSFMLRSQHLAAWEGPQELPWRMCGGPCKTQVCTLAGDATSAFHAMIQKPGALSTCALRELAHVHFRGLQPPLTRGSSFQRMEVERQAEHLRGLRSRCFSLPSCAPIHPGDMYSQPGANTNPCHVFALMYFCLNGDGFIITCTCFSWLAQPVACSHAAPGCSQRCQLGAAAKASAGALCNPMAGNGASACSGGRGCSADTAPWRGTAAVAGPLAVSVTVLHAKVVPVSSSLQTSPPSFQTHVHIVPYHLGKQNRCCLAEIWCIADKLPSPQVMLSSIVLQMGGAEPGVESTYWWMGADEPKRKAPRPPKARPLD